MSEHLVFDLGRLLPILGAIQSQWAESCSSQAVVSNPRDGEVQESDMDR